jgi:FtsH-binding integral membrane protein
MAMVTLNFLGTSFCLLTFERGLLFASSLYYYVYIYLIVAFVIFRFMGLTKMIQGWEKKALEAASSKTKED